MYLRSFRALEGHFLPFPCSFYEHSQDIVFSADVLATLRALYIGGVGGNSRVAVNTNFHIRRFYRLYLYVSVLECAHPFTFAEALAIGPNARVILGKVVFNVGGVALQSGFSRLIQQGFDLIFGAARTFLALRDRARRETKGSAHD